MFPFEKRNKCSPYLSFVSTRAATVEVPLNVRRTFLQDFLGRISVNALSVLSVLSMPQLSYHILKA